MITLIKDIPPKTRFKSYSGVNFIILKHVYKNNNKRAKSEYLYTKIKNLDTNNTHEYTGKIFVEIIT
jgi:hypothetical protein